MSLSHIRACASYFILLANVILTTSLTKTAIHGFLRHKKQKDEDIAICECKYDPDDPDSACGDGCLNVLTSTECAPGYCPCGELCKNQVCPISLYLVR